MRQSANISPIMKAAEKTAAMLGRRQAQPGRMFAQQNSLANLPLPPLQQTLYKYLLALKPILSTEDYEATQAVCIPNSYFTFFFILLAFDFSKCRY